MSHLFSPLTVRGTTFRNRVFVAPMCQYSSVDGRPGDWHLVHLGSYARGGAALVMTEATAVTDEGRISPYDAGIWTDELAADYERLTAFIAGQGAAPAIQLAHAGRKASTQRPLDGHAYVEPADGGWVTVGPSPVGFGALPAPKELSVDGIAEIVRAFRDAAERADRAGFEVAEIHGAHGYLLHQFLSPLVNERDDRYGGGFEGRSRLLLEVVDAVAEVWPERKPLLVRLSATDWAEGGWSLEETVEVARLLREHRVDMVDVSSGGAVAHQQVVAGPGYQVPFAKAVRDEAGIATVAVGLITGAQQAEEIVAEGSADAVMLARALIREPHWALDAAAELGAEVRWPDQYLRGRR